MARRRAFAAVAVTVLLAAVTTWGQAAPAQAAGDQEPVTVLRVVDGDTLDVRRADGSADRVRLLNVDTPETVDPDRPVQCLGPEASAALAQLVPLGSAVTLAFDEERTDRYGRTLAAVTSADGTLVNAELARRGLARPLLVGDNDRWMPQVEAASREAQQAGAGLYSRELTCTAPARAAVAERLRTEVQRPLADTTTASLAERAAAAAALVSAASSLQVDAAAGGGEVWSLAGQGAQQISSTTSASLTIALAATRAVNAVPAEARTPAPVPTPTETTPAPAPSAPSAAPSSRAPRPSAAPATPRRTAAPAPAPAPEPEAPAPAPSTTPPAAPAPAPAPTAAPAPAPTGGGLEGYTGCRSYAPGGGSWAPIPCPR